MLKNIDLKVNNIIASGKNFTELSIVGKVLSIGNDEQEFEQIYCECEESFEWFFKDHYCGVPITRDSLLKAKFDENLFSYSKRINVTYSNWESIELVENNDKNGYWYLGFRQGDYVSKNQLHKNSYVFLRRDLQYIHELQQIYKFFTKEELDFDFLIQEEKEEE